MVKRKKFYIALLVIVSILFTMSSFAQMSSDNYTLRISTVTSTGQSKSSNNFNIIDSAGQPTAIGRYEGNTYILEAGFLYGSQFSDSAGETALNIINALTNILDIGSLTNQEENKLEQAIKFLEDAIDAFAEYELGDLNALTKALNKIKIAIKQMAMSGLDTQIYQEMLVQTAKISVAAEINRISSIAGPTHPSIIDAIIFLNEGSVEFIDGLYEEAVRSFVKAYNTALSALG